MKKIILFVALFIAGVSVSNAKTSDLFRYDHSRVEMAFVTLNQVDRIVSQKHITLPELKAMFELDANDTGNKLLGIPGFIWGMSASIIAGGIGCFASWNIGVWLGIMLVGGLMGVLLVYLTTEDKKQATNALLGCIAGTGLMVGLIFVLAIGYGIGSSGY